MGIFDQPTDQDALRLAHAIALQESGSSGTPNYKAVGDAGTSHGAYQWQPGNFEAAAKEAGLNPNDLSPENQDKVAYYQVKKYKDQGLDPGQIASKWNSGSPDNWKDHSGDTIINGQKIHYDTPAYVKGVQKYYNSLGPSTSSGLSQTANNAGSKDNFLTNVGNDLSNRLKDLGSAVSNTVTGKINPISGVVQSAGALAGGVGDVVGESVKGLYNTFVPEAIRNPINQAVGSVAGAVVNSPLGQSIGSGVGQFQQTHPELSKDISSLTDIAMLLPIGKGVGLAARAADEAIPAATRGLASSGGIVGDIAQKRLFNEALDVVAPKETAKTLKQGIKSGRGNVSGISGTVSMAPDQGTIRAAQAAAGIVRKGKTAVENANAIKGAIGDTATQLKSELKNMEITPIVSQEDLQGLMQNAMTKIMENPVMVGNPEESARRILNQFKTYLPKTGDITASDLLDARQKLDGWMASQTGGGTVFDPAYENAKTIALRAIRQEANGLVADKAPRVAVKQMLAKQSALYDALDNIAAKGTKEVGTGRLTRFGQRHPNVRGLVKFGGSSLLGGLGLGEAQNLLGGGK